MSSTCTARPHRRSQDRRVPILPIRSRWGFVAVGVLAAALAGCSDDAVAPASDTQASVGAAAAARAPFTTALASISWNEQARTLVMRQPLSPTTAARAYGLLALAQYGAVVAADDGKSDGTLDDGGFGEGGRSRYEAERGAVAGASARILTYLFPSAATALAQRVVDEGNMGPGDVHPQFTRGLAIGTAMGDRMIAWAQTDGFSTPWPGTIPVGAGKWTGTAPVAGAPHANMRPYALSSPSQFRSPPPPAFGSAAYLADLQEVRTISDTRTAEQLRIARDRNLSTGSITGLGFFNELASTYITDAGLDERSAAHVFAVLNAAGSDAVIGCWDSKLHYFYIRPSQADPAITLPIGLPNHPSYPSGHSCLSGAAVEVLTAFFPMRASELQAHMVEAGMSRIYAGIHYRFDVTAGQTLGRAVGAQTLRVDRNVGVLNVIP